MESADLPMSDLETRLRVFSDNPYVQAALVLVVALLLAKLAQLLIARGIGWLTQRTRSELDDAFIKILHRPVFITVALLGCVVAVHLIAPSELARDVVVNLLQSVTIVVWMVFGVRAAVLVLGALAEEEGRLRIVQPATRPLFETVAKVMIVTLGVYFILISWGIDPVGWMATAGIAAVALGLAAQDTLGNLFAGIQILADAPYKIGDYIVLDGKDRGIVTRIGLRSTRILTEDDIEINLPNSVIARSKVVNESAGRWLKQRLRIPVGVAYGTDPERVQKVLAEAAAGVPGVCREPQPWVQFSAFGDSALQFEIRCWIEDAGAKGRLVSEVNVAAYRALRQNAIEIPFPQRDLHLKRVPTELLQALRPPRG